MNFISVHKVRTSQEAGAGSCSALWTYTCEGKLHSLPSTKVHGIASLVTNTDTWHNMSICVLCQDRCFSGSLAIKLSVLLLLLTLLAYQCPGKVCRPIGALWPVPRPGRGLQCTV